MITTRVNEDYDIIIQKGNITTDTQVQTLIFRVWLLQHFGLYSSGLATCRCFLKQLEVKKVGLLAYARDKTDITKLMYYN